MRKDTPVLKDLVLVGGGHSHVGVLRRFGMKPLPGLRLTLICRDVHTPYSGMLPGYIAGHYRYDECHIDLRPLARFAGCRFIHAEVDGVELADRRVSIAGRPSIPFDALSLNIGSRPRTVDVPGAAELALPVKPIDRFLVGWKALVERVMGHAGRFRIAVVGGGAGGVELSLSTQYRLRSMLPTREGEAVELEYHLLTNTPEILPTHNAGVRRRFVRVLKERGIRVHTDHAVEGLERGLVRCRGGTTLEVDAVLWVTQASAPDWLSATGLDTDGEGFVQVNEHLQSTSHDEVFAAGDVASMVDNPRAKSGVFAVRQGPHLAANLRRYAQGRPLTRYRPQTSSLALISTGDKYAVASRGKGSLEGRWAWRLKDWIDRRFMQKYNELPEMESEPRSDVDPALLGGEGLKEISALAMRCGGCGAKVGSTVLSRVVNRLTPVAREDVLLGLNEPDDAAVVEVPPGQVAVQTVDYFRAFLTDDYVFGRIAANHSLGDIFAMGARPQSAMAIATVPYGRESVVEQQLYQMMVGAVEVLNDAGAALVGGHSSEGAELAFGLAVTGLAERSKLLRKGGMGPHESLVLTKPLGTGTLFAADMRGKARGRWIAGAVKSMLMSNQAAAECLFRHGATACTDVTGFGLLGHLAEMTRPSEVDARIELEALPILEGALETVRAGVFSSLQPQNVRLRRAVRNMEEASGDERYPLLFDPQTAGGLLASVPADRVSACVAELNALGYESARIIGCTEPRGDALEPITLVSAARLN